MKGGATISKCRVYRFLLWRELEPSLEAKGTVLFIMLNPSEADEKDDDPTIRRCIGFAERWGHRRLEVVNLSPIRARTPDELIHVIGEWQSPEEVMNERYIEQAIDRAELVVAAWGANVVRCGLETQALCVTELCDELRILGLTKYGHPRHPLYVPRSTIPMRWNP